MKTDLLGAEKLLHHVCMVTLNVQTDFKLSICFLPLGGLKSFFNKWYFYYVEKSTSLLPDRPIYFTLTHEAQAYQQGPGVNERGD